MPSIRKFEAAACWLNGNSLVGEIEEIEFPEITWEMMEHETLALRGVIEYPKRTEAMEATITWASYSETLATFVADPWTAVNLQVRANFGSYDGGSKTADIPHIISMTGRFKSNPLGTFSADDFERECMMSIDYVKETFNGIDILEYGINPPIYRTAANGSNLGTDLFAQLRANLGL